MQIAVRQRVRGHCAPASTSAQSRSQSSSLRSGRPCVVVHPVVDTCHHLLTFGVGVGKRKSGRHVPVSNSAVHHLVAISTLNLCPCQWQEMDFAIHGKRASDRPRMLIGIAPCERSIELEVVDVVVAVDSHDR